MVLPGKRDDKLLVLRTYLSKSSIEMMMRHLPLATRSPFIHQLSLLIGFIALCLNNLLTM